jgi:putative copper export protein
MTALVISLFFHVTFTAFWIGGMLFLPLVILPGIKDHPDRIKLLYVTEVRFRKVGWVALLGLLITGIINLYTRHIPFEWDFFTQTSYGNWFSIKLMLFVLMLLIGAYHDFYTGKKALEDYVNNPDPKFRRIASVTGRINLLLALMIAFIGIGLGRGFF